MRLRFRQLVLVVIQDVQHRGERWATLNTIHRLKTWIKTNQNHLIDRPLAVLVPPALEQAIHDNSLLSPSIGSTASVNTEHTSQADTICFRCSPKSNGIAAGKMPVHGRKSILRSNIFVGCQQSPAVCRNTNYPTCRPANAAVVHTGLHDMVNAGAVRAQALRLSAMSFGQAAV